MRRRDEDKAKKWIGWFIISIMVLSVLAFGASFVTQGTNSLSRHNGFKFQQLQTNGEWQVEVGDVTHQFVYHPTQITPVTIDESALAPLREAFQVSISFDPALDEPQYVDYARLRLAEHFLLQDIQVAQGINQESEIYSLPLVGCDAAKALQPVVMLELGNETMVTVEGNCITLTSTSEINLLQLTESLRYKLLGVIV